MTNGVETRIILTADEIKRALTRIAHEILERNGGAEDVVLVGIHTRGVPLAERLSKYMKEFENTDIPLCELDISLYRDEYIENKDKTHKLKC